MHYFDHTIDNRIQYLYFMRSLLLLKSPILAKSWCASLLLQLHKTTILQICNVHMFKIMCMMCGHMLYQE